MSTDKPSQAEGEDPDRPDTGHVRPQQGHPSQAEGEDPDDTEHPEDSMTASDPHDRHVTGEDPAIADVEDLENASAEEDEPAEPKPGGLGEDGTIPPDPDGVAAGHTGVRSTFEPEEDEQAPQ